MKWQIDRRTFLRSATGPLLPLPFLNLMSRQASGAVAAQTPVRFVTLFKPNGVHPPSWNINGGKEFDFRMSPLMQPFASHKQDLLLLDNMGDFGFSSHANSTRRFLSGHHRSTKGASIDQVIADKVGAGTAHRSLELTTEGLFPSQIGCSYISYNADGDPMPRETDPQLIFDRLFRNPLAHAGKRREMASLLDRVREDAKDLSRRAGAEDRKTLDHYLTIVRETEKRLGNLKHLSHPDKDVATFERPLAPANLDEQVNAMIDIIALALWTDSTRCITYMLGNSNSRMIFDFLGVNQQHHYLSHFFRNFSRQNLDALLQISLWHMKKFDYLLNRMKAFKDAEGTLLQNSIVLYGSGMGHSDNHTVKRVPIVLAGQGRGMLKTGRYVRYGKNQQLGRLHLALARKFGLQMDSFGGSDSPLPGLNDSSYTPYAERPFESWTKVDAATVEVQGRLRLSEDLDEARIFYVDVQNAKPVRIEVGFRDFHSFNLAYHCGEPVLMKGNGSTRDGQLLITKIQSLTPVHGKKPGTQKG